MRVDVGIVAAVTAWASAAGAFEVPMGTQFANPDKDGMPAAWRWHAYSGYLPYGDVQVPEEGALRLFNARGREGSFVRSSARLAVREGDVVTVALEARGEGRARYTLYLCDAQGGWITSLPSEGVRLAKGQWLAQEFAFVVKGLGNAPSGFAELAFGVRAGADVTFRNVRVTRRLMEERIVAEDDFEEARRSRPGNPRRIVDHVAPGLFSTTGQGAYSTKDRVDLVPDEKVAVPTAEEEQFLTSGVRVYGFGRRGQRHDSRLEMAFAEGAKRAVLAIEHRADRETLTCVCPDGGRLEVPYASLPADVAFSVRGDGLCEMTVTSLADTSAYSRTFTADFFKTTSGRTVVRRISLVAENGGEAEVFVDNLRLVRSAPERQREVEIPYRANPEPTFDPVKAGWPLVFSDEFDGDQVDFAKWERKKDDRQLKYARVKDGALHIAADLKPGTTNLVTTGFWSRENFGYGYFESRLRFTSYNGWWAAFWLCQHRVENPFVDGYEIDIFEDFSLRNEPRNLLDHNLHTQCAGTYKSYKCNSLLPGGLGDWYVVGCKWTPFEITFYLNGKAIAEKRRGGTYETATFDAFRNGACICPLKAIVSGQIMENVLGWHAPVSGERYPEFFDVDWVRVYRWPGAEPGAAPEVAITSSEGKSAGAVEGQRIVVRAEVKPAKSGAKIRQVHLFDNGCYLLTKTKPPYDFTVPMTRDFFARTMWLKPGRTGDVPVFRGSHHVFCAFAEDERGMVGHSGTVEVKLGAAKRGLGELGGKGGN